MADMCYKLSVSSDRDESGFPTNFKPLVLLGEGSFGMVVKCLIKDTEKTVAIKIPVSHGANDNEVSMMEKLMPLKLESDNIVQFLGWYDAEFGKAMVFETLDISLYHYMKKQELAPMLLSDIRTVTQQLAAAFDFLKGLGVIHTDLKPDNIMMVDHQRRPFRVKLIDFGLAMDRSEAEQGTRMQVLSYRALEIILGLPFSEAIDIWALGCVMFYMLHGIEPFAGRSVFNALHDIISLLGLPEDHLLQNGLKARRFFTKSESNTWSLKTHQEYWEIHANELLPYEADSFITLNNMKRVRFEKNNDLEGKQRAQCIDLLEAMLSLDQDKRITPTEILKHPFIICGQNSSNNRKQQIHPEEMKQLDIDEKILYPSPASTPPGVILVRPAAAENTRLLEDEETAATSNRKQQINPEEMKLLDIDEKILYPSPASIPPGVILVRPAAAENTRLLEDEETAATSNRKQQIHPEEMKQLDIDEKILYPSHASIPPGVILVRPAAAENTRLLEDEETAVCVFRLEMDSDTSDSDTSDSDTSDSDTSDSDTTDGDTMASTTEGPETQKTCQQKKKKKKCCFCRICSWTRKTFSCFRPA